MEGNGVTFTFPEDPPGNAPFAQFVKWARRWARKAGYFLGSLFDPWIPPPVVSVLQREFGLGLLDADPYETDGEFTV